MPSRIVDYSKTASSPGVLDFNILNLLICGNTAKSGQASTIVQLGRKYLDSKYLLC
jgi:hypothetical protein